MAEDREALVARRWTIAGRVQGVGYRWYVLDQAQLLGVGGWVANTADGGVEAVGLASEETLGLFAAALAKGPPAAKVTRIVAEDVPHYLVDSKSFTIKH